MPTFKVIKEVPMRMCPYFGDRFTYNPDFPDGMLPVGTQFTSEKTYIDLAPGGPIPVPWEKSSLGGYVPHNHHTTEGEVYLEEVPETPVLVHKFAFYSDGSYTEPAQNAPEGLTTTHLIGLYSNGTYEEVTQNPDPGTYTQYYVVKHDRERGPLWRKTVPEVYPVGPDHRVYNTEPIQKLDFALQRIGAPSQTLARAKNRFETIWSHDRGMSNKSCGFGLDTNPLKDFINNNNLDNPDAGLPCRDKPRVFGGQLVTGVEKYSLLFGISNLFQKTKFEVQKLFAPNTSFMAQVKQINYGAIGKAASLLVQTNYLEMVTINADEPLPTPEEVYKKPELCPRAVTVAPDGSNSNWPQGDGEMVLIPFITSHSKGKPRISLDDLHKLPLGEIIDPYGY